PKMITPAGKIHWHTIEFSNITHTTNQQPPKATSPAGEQFFLEPAYVFLTPHNHRNYFPAGRCRSR
ncbi:hypothetical protein ACFOX2_10755, partial [Corynebacterium marambiense]|uniref:hypothetical protein n=1 Tax=Corynebacterium marambiense TaxID=2765364 RepID=UPI00361C05B4